MQPIFAPVAKLADAPDLGSGVLRRVGSSPIGRTKKPKRLYVNLLGFFFSAYGKLVYCNLARMYVVKTTLDQKASVFHLLFYHRILQYPFHLNTRMSVNRTVKTVRLPY